MVGQYLVLERREMTEDIEEFGLRRLEDVAEFADKLECSARSIGTAQPGLSRDVRRAAVELRQLVLLLRDAMGATEGDVVISLDAESCLAVSTKPVPTRLLAIRK
jgi:hypothetical protein